MKRLLSIPNLVLPAYLIATASPVMAAEFQLQQVHAGGNGCPNSSVQFKVSEDKTHASLSLNPIEVESDVPGVVKRKSCNLAISIHVSPGFSIAPLPVTASGYAAVESGGFASVHLEAFFAGQRGSEVSQKFNGPVDDLFTQKSQDDSPRWSPCGEDVNYRLNLSVLANTLEPGVLSYLSLDEIGEIRFKVKRCSEASHRK